MAAPASGPPRYLDKRWLAEHLAEERRSADLLSEVREAIFGAQDGVTSILAVVITVATATNQQLTVLIAGLAAALAEVLSMGAGEYMSSKSQREIFLGQIEKERREVEERPGESEAEVALMLEREGLRSIGFQAENLDGGVTAWSRAGLPLVAKDGGPGRVI